MCSHSEPTSIFHASVSPLSSQTRTSFPWEGRSPARLQADLLPFFSSAPERAALRSSGKRAVWPGLRPGGAGHPCWLRPHHLLPEALLKWYVGASGGAGWGQPCGGTCVDLPGLPCGMGRSLSGEACMGHHGASSLLGSQLHTVTGHRNGLSGRGDVGSCRRGACG